VLIRYLKEKWLDILSAAYSVSNDPGLKPSDFSACSTGLKAGASTLKPTLLLKFFFLRPAFYSQAAAPGSLDIP
jgi:hypothetical protein